MDGLFDLTHNPLIASSHTNLIIARAVPDVVRGARERAAAPALVQSTPTKEQGAETLRPLMKPRSHAVAINKTSAFN